MDLHLTGKRALVTGSTAGIGFAIARALATEGARAVLRFAFDELGRDEIVAYTTTTNLRSRRVMEKLEMTYDPEDDFDHPRIAPGHPLRPHVVYRIRSTNRQGR